jgi:hypothetical protein
MGGVDRRLRCVLASLWGVLPACRGWREPPAPTASPVARGHRTHTSLWLRPYTASKGEARSAGPPRKAHGRRNFADYNQEHVHARLQDVYESAAAARSSVRLLCPRGQPGAYHASGTALPDPHAAPHPDARRDLDRLQVTPSRSTVALASAYHGLGATGRLRGRAGARPLSALETRPPVLR